MWKSAEEAKQELLTITTEKLENAGACYDQREVFEGLFPEGSVVVTEELCEKHSADFEWSWASTNLLRYPFRQQFHDDMVRPNTELNAIYDAITLLRNNEVAPYEVSREMERQASLRYEVKQARAFARAFIQQANHRAAVIGKRIARMSMDDLRFAVLYMTEERLEEKSACGGSIRRFVEYFPDGVEISPDICEKHRDDFDWESAADYFLDSEHRKEWETKDKEFNQTYHDLTREASERRRRSETTWDEEERVYRETSTNFRIARAREFGTQMVKMYETMKAAQDAAKDSASA
jgi:hypothetical protein